MAKKIRVYQQLGSPTGIPPVASMRYVDGATFIEGAVVIYSAGSVTTAGADPALGTIVGVALQDAASNPGYDVANAAKTTTYTGRSQTVAVVRPNGSTIFASSLVTTTDVEITPAQSNVGVEYGITAFSGRWAVDTAKTGATARVEVVGFDATSKTVFWRFLDTALTDN